MHTNRYGFRSGKYALVIGTRMVTVEGVWRPCFEVEFSDGIRDLWPIYDPDEPYEFSGFSTKTSYVSSG